MVEEALPLLEFLRANDGAMIDMTDCDYVHTAVLQVLAAAAPKTLSLPTSPAMAGLIGAVIRAAPPCKL